MEPSWASLFCERLDQQAGIAYRVGFGRGRTDSAAVAMREDYQPKP
jgi:hypothetical protein